MHQTLPLLIDTDFPPLTRAELTTLQVNLGYRCNQQCMRCHVDAGPQRKESMTRETRLDRLFFRRVFLIFRLMTFASPFPAGISSPPATSLGPVL